MNRLAVLIVLNVEVFDGDTGPAVQPHLAAHTPDTANGGWRAYGNAHGLPRLLRMFAQRDLPFSVALNADVLTREPAVAALLKAQAPALIAHGTSNSTPLPTDDGVDAETAYVTQTLDLIEAGMGRRPSAWLSPNFRTSLDTPNALARAGIACSLDDTGGEQVHREGALHLVPYGLAANDMTLVMTMHQDPRTFAQTVLDHVQQRADEQADDELTREQAVVAIGLHTFIAGQPAYARALAEALDEMADMPEIWFTTCEELLDV